MCWQSLSCSPPTDATVSRPTQLIRGELHGSVTVLCPSGDTQSDKNRFWCKVGRSSCTLIASSDGYVGRRYQGRILITPQESSGAFRVLINDLKKEDSGLYLCGTRGLRGQESPQEVVLQVATGRTGHGRGGSVMDKGCEILILCPPLQPPPFPGDPDSSLAQSGARCPSSATTIPGAPTRGNTCAGGRAGAARCCWTPGDLCWSPTEGGSTSPAATPSAAASRWS